MTVRYLFLVLLGSLMVISTTMAQASTTAATNTNKEKDFYKCFVCGGNNKICKDKDDMGSEKTCPAGSETCFVATNSEATYRGCGSGAKITSNSDCKKSEMGGRDVDVCWCKGDLCNTGYSMKVGFLTMLLSFSVFLY
eukprot:TRINITY_DN15166_c0_g1_i1.p1 TRINITY_DN15166_c0_g1~~TRINITY_DN15166_c0_g1_i1.p1  ORF type:complete len:148 (+),score=21.68 TRINITY_DN15166_c0_g1_i1:32-445(+)